MSGIDSMTVEEVNEFRIKMEKDLILFLVDQFKEFEQKLGVTPQGVNVELYEVTSIGDRWRHHKPVGVRFDIDLIKQRIY